MKNKWHSSSNTLEVPGFFFFKQLVSDFFLIYSDESAEMFTLLATSEVTELTKCTWPPFMQLRHWATRSIFISIGKRATLAKQ